MHDDVRDRGSTGIDRAEMANYIAQIALELATLARRAGEDRLADVCAEAALEATRLFNDIKAQTNRESDRDRSSS